MSRIAHVILDNFKSMRSWKGANPEGSYVKDITMQSMVVKSFLKWQIKSRVFQKAIFTYYADMAFVLVSVWRFHGH